MEIDLKHLREAKATIHAIARLQAIFENEVGTDNQLYNECIDIALGLEKLGVVDSAETYVNQEMEKARDEIKKEMK